MTCKFHSLYTGDKELESNLNSRHLESKLEDRLLTMRARILKVTAFASLSVLLLGIPSWQAHAAVKVGASCSPVGKVVKSGSSTLTCTKSGKKLVWVASKALPKPDTVAPTNNSGTVIPTASTNSTIKFQSEGCHAHVSATLQKKSGNDWVAVVDAEGWENVPGCDSDHPYEPFAYADIPDGTVVRWKVFVPGGWEWFSTPVTVKRAIAPTVGAKIPAIPSTKFADVANTAINSLLADMPTTSTLIPTTYIFEDSILPIERSVIKNGVNSALSHFSPSFLPTSNLHIFVFATSEFLKNEAPKADPTNKAFKDDMANMATSWGKRSVQNCLGMGGFSVSETPFPFIAIDAPCAKNDPAAYGVLPHEITHALQTVVGSANPRCWAPTWLVEGQAQVGGSTLAMNENGSATSEHRKSWVERIVKPSSIDAFVAMEGETTDFSEYTRGAALSEYLVAKGGWNRSVQLYKTAALFTSQGCPSGKAKMENFNNAFLSIYGQSVSDFYVEALPYVQWISEHL